jgi:hypothetical protein
VDVVEAAPTGARKQAKRTRAAWAALTLTGAAAFWSANLLISLTSTAAAYRSALSIRYLPMLLQAAVGGLVLAGVVTSMLVRFGARVPGGGPVRRALFLAACALVIVTVIVEAPAKFAADIDQPGRWLLVATLINTIRVLVLGLAIGLMARTRDLGHGPPRPVATKETTP